MKKQSTTAAQKPDAKATQEVDLRDFEESHHKTKQAVRKVVSTPPREERDEFHAITELDEILAELDPNLCRQVLRSAILFGESSQTAFDDKAGAKEFLEKLIRTSRASKGEIVSLEKIDGEEHLVTLASWKGPNLSMVPEEEYSRSLVTSVIRKGRPQMGSGTPTSMGGSVLTTMIQMTGSWAVIPLFKSSPTDKGGFGAIILMRDAEEAFDKQMDLLRAYGRVIGPRLHASNYYKLMKEDRDTAEREQELLETRLVELQAEFQGEPALRRIAGRRSRGTIKSLEKIKMAVTPVMRERPVLIVGETGVGKELYARAIHDHSLNTPWNKGRFVPINCAQYPQGSDLLRSELFGHVEGSFTGARRGTEGVFRDAAGGTVFLDELSKTDLEVQRALLRAVAEKVVSPVGNLKIERPINVRFIGAVNEDPEELIEDGRLLPDLYARLKYVKIEIPPLRHRLADIPDLANYILANEAKKIGADELAELAENGKGFTADALKGLARHEYPQNVRDLEALITGAMALNEKNHKIDVVLLQQADESFHPASEEAWKQRGEELRRDMADRALELTDYNVKAAAEYLGVNHAHLYRRLKAWGVDIKKYRRQKLNQRKNRQREETKKRGGSRRK